MRLAATTLLALVLVAATANHSAAAPMDNAPASPSEHATDPVFGLDGLLDEPANNQAINPAADTAAAAMTHEDKVAHYRALCPTLSLLPEPHNPPASLKEFNGVEITNVGAITAGDAQYRLGIEKASGKCMLVDIFERYSPILPEDWDAKEKEIHERAAEVKRHLYSSNEELPIPALRAVSVGDEGTRDWIIIIIEPYDMMLEDYIESHKDRLSLEAALRAATAIVLVLKMHYERGIGITWEWFFPLALMRKPDDTSEFPFHIKLDPLGVGRHVNISPDTPEADKQAMAKSTTQIHQEAGRMVEMLCNAMSSDDKNTVEAQQLRALAEEIKGLDDTESYADLLLRMEPLRSHIEAHPELYPDAPRSRVKSTRKRA